MRLVISDPKTGKSYQKELDASAEAAVVGKKIGDELDGSLVGAAGYKFVLTGGSDKSSIPMRGDVPGNRKAYLLLSGGTGYKPQTKGARKRKVIRGNGFSSEIMQVNSKIVAHDSGAAPLEQLFPKAAEKK